MATLVEMVEVGGREAWNAAQQVADRDEDEGAREQGEVPLRAVPDDILHQVFKPLDDHFQNPGEPEFRRGNQVFLGIGVAPTDEKAHDNQNNEHQQGTHDVLPVSRRRR